jgi:oligoendopeptidase F
MDPENCDTQWQSLNRRFQPDMDWSGLDEIEESGWHRKLHIYQAPFYYVEYGLAQLGAVQVWANALKNQGEAVRNYRKALALGGTANLPTLFRTAGAKFGFDAETLGTAIELMESTIDRLERL